MTGHTTKSRSLVPVLLAVAVGAVLVGCSSTEPTGQSAAEPASPSGSGEAPEGVRTAVALLEPTDGHRAGGTVTFTQAADGIHVTATIEGLSPGEHGFHVHEFGDCAAPDASSAGGHFNPDGTPHGAPDAPPDLRHAGDLGNIEADASGHATYDRLDSDIAFSGDHSIIGKSVIVHQGRDDLTSQPSGDAGPRVACGIIEMQSDETDAGSAGS